MGNNAPGFVQSSGGNTTTNFQTWVANVRAAILTTGLVLENAGTAGGSPVTNGTDKQFYEIYKFNDSLQTSGAPLFLKVMYGSQNFSSNFWRLHVQLGTAYSGAVMTDPFSTEFLAANYYLGNNTAFSTANYASGDGSGIALAFGLGGAANSNGIGSIFIIDRHRNPANGNALGTGAFVLSAPNVSGVPTRTLGNCSFGSGATAHTYTATPCITDGSLSSTTAKTNVGGQTQLYPWWSITPAARGISKMIVTYNEADASVLSSGGLACSFLGGSHRYLTIGDRVGGAFSAQAETGAAPAIWWS